MGKETMNAKGFVDDIKAGMDDAGLMEKYRLSGDLLQSVFEKLVDMGLLKRHDLEKKPSCLKNPLQLLGNARRVAYLNQKHTMNARDVVSLRRSSRNRALKFGIFGNPDGPSDGQGC